MPWSTMYLELVVHFYLVGQKARSHFSVPSYGKTQTNFLAHPTLGSSSPLPTPRMFTYLAVLGLSCAQ